MLLTAFADVQMRGIDVEVVAWAATTDVDEGAFAGLTAAIAGNFVSVST